MVEKTEIIQPIYNAATSSVLSYGSGFPLPNKFTDIALKYINHSVEYKVSLLKTREYTFKNEFDKFSFIIIYFFNSFLSPDFDLKKELKGLVEKNTILVSVINDLTDSFDKYLNDYHKENLTFSYLEKENVKRDNLFSTYSKENIKTAEDFFSFTLELIYDTFYDFKNIIIRHLLENDSEFLLKYPDTISNLNEQNTNNNKKLDFIICMVRSIFDDILKGDKND